VIDFIPERVIGFTGMRTRIVITAREVRERGAGNTTSDLPAYVDRAASRSPRASVHAGSPAGCRAKRR